MFLHSETAIMRTPLFAAALICATMITAGDVYRFRGDNSLGKYNETGLLKTWPQNGLSPKWTYKGLGVGWGSVIKVGNRLYIAGTDQATPSIEIVVCLDLNGNKIWQTKVGKVWARSYQGARCTPTYAPDNGGRIVALSGSGELFCLDADHGKIVWNKNIAETYETKFGHWGMAESPVIKDGVVYVVAGGSKALAVALKLTDGAVVWESKPNNDNCAYVSPALLDNQLITMTASKVNGINIKTGNILWENDYRASAGNVKWGGINCNPPYVKGRQFFVTAGYNQGGVMYELNPEGNGVKILWTSKDLDPHHDGVVEVNGRLYGSNWHNNRNGNWCCLDWNTGKTIYETPWDKLGKGSTIYADGMLYIYEEKRGTFALAKPGDSLNIVSSFQITFGTKEHWAHPVICDGMLYIRRGNDIAAFDIKEK